METGDGRNIGSGPQPLREVEVEDGNGLKGATGGGEMREVRFLVFRYEERMERGLKGIDVEIIVSDTNKMIGKGIKSTNFTHTLTEVAL